MLALLYIVRLVRRRKPHNMSTRQTQIVKEIEFVQQRALHLAVQPRNVYGVLLREDDRAEAGMLRQLIEELEGELL